MNKTERRRISRDRLYPYIGANRIIGYIDDYLFDGKILCVAEDGGSWGAWQRCAFVYEGKCWVSNHAHVLQETERVRLDYLKHYLNYADLSGFITGTTRGKLTKAALDQIVVPLPAVSVQEKLVRLLDTAEALVAKRQQALAKLDELVEAFFIERFGDPVDNPRRYVLVPLGEICDVRDGTHESPAYVSAGYPLITSRHLANGTIDFDAAKLIAEADFQAINKRSKVDKGDILLPMIGTIGRPVIVDTERPFAIKNVALIKFAGADRVSNVYLKTLLDSPYFAEWMHATKRGGTQRFIGLGDLRSFPVPLPPLSEQQAFARTYEQIQHQKQLMHRQLARLEENLRGLLQRVFAGELTIR
nr:restriction endonuclease subunit S [Brevibacillus sp. SYP-B805]